SARDTNHARGGFQFGSTERAMMRHRERRDSNSQSRQEVVVRGSEHEDDFLSSTGWQVTCGSIVANVQRSPIRSTIVTVADFSSEWSQLSGEIGAARPRVLAGHRSVFQFIDGMFKFLNTT